MFARMILALLLAAFALPALVNGPCHDAPVAAAPLHHGSHGIPRHDDRASVPHVCIGCIPPASIAPRAAAARVPTPPLAHRIVAVAFAPASGTPPALPPPRADA